MRQTQSALRDLNQKINVDDDSKRFSSLQATNFSILDVMADGDDSTSSDLNLELQRREAAERRMRVLLASQPPGASSSAASASSSSAATSSASSLYSPSLSVGTTPYSSSSSSGRQSFSSLGNTPRLSSNSRCPCCANCCGRCWLRLTQRFETFTSAPKSWVYLLLLGFLSALIAFFVDGPVLLLTNLKSSLLGDVSTPVGYFIALPWTIALTLVAAFVVDKVPLADGSGIPQMRSILAGTSLPQYLSFKVGVAKLVSLICAVAAGLSIGREGPFVHLAAVVAMLLLKVPYFRAIGRNETMKRQLLAASVAAGVTATFGTPIGSVLFSIEVTSTVFLTSTYWRCFLVAVVCRLAFDIFSVLKQDAMLASTTFAGGELSLELFAFVAVGVVCGLLGSVFVMAVNKCRVARKLLMTTTSRKYILVTACAAFVASALYLTPYLRLNDKTVINDLFSNTQQQPTPSPAPANGTSNANTAPSMAIFGAPNEATVLFSLAVYFGVRFLATVVSISLPVACGLFVPLFVLGGVVGRFCGELIQVIFSDSDVAVSPAGVYAVIGAAALTSGATQTVSTAVIVFELTGQTSFLLPVLLSTLVAYSVSGIFSISIYDLLLTLSGLPFLPRVYNSSVYSLSAGDLMHSTSDGDVGFLTLNSTYRDALNLLLTGSSSSEGGSGGGGPISPSGRYPCLAIASAVAPSGSSSASSGSTSGRSSSVASSAAARTKGDQFADFTQVQQAIALVDDTASMTLLGTISRAKLESIFQRRAALYRLQKRADSAATAGRNERQQLLATGGGLPMANAGERGGGGENSGESGLRGVSQWLSRTLTREDNDSPAPAENTALSSNGATVPSSSDSNVPGFMRLRSRFRQWVLGDEPLSSLVLPDDFLDSKLCFRGLPHHLMTRPMSAGYQVAAILAASPVPAAPAPTPVDGVPVSTGLPLRSEAVSSESLVAVDPAPLTVSDASPLSRVHYLFAVCLFPEILCMSTEGKLSGVILKNDLSHSRRLLRTRTASNAASLTLAGGADAASASLASREKDNGIAHDGSGRSHSNDSTAARAAGEDGDGGSALGGGGGIL